MTRKSRQNSAFYWIYMLECDDGSFYTGYTTNLARRYRQHVDGTANARYTATHPPVRIAQCWRLFDSIGCALRAERAVKSAGRAAKERFVRHPETLEAFLVHRLGLGVRISPFDPTAVEKASRHIAARDIKTAPDPFANVPQATD